MKITIHNHDEENYADGVEIEPWDSNPRLVSISAGKHSVQVSAEELYRAVKLLYEKSKEEST